MWGALNDLYVGTLTLPDRLWWCHWALEVGHWSIDDDGSWDSDLTRCPGLVFDDIAHRHVPP